VRGQLSVRRQTDLVAKDDDGLDREEEEEEDEDLFGFRV
jgi:hypothetical protein